MTARIAIQRASESLLAPTDQDIRRWAVAAIADEQADAELSIRIVDSEEMQKLNVHYRNQDKATNVLAFTAELPPGIPVPLLGDVVICADVVALEARQQEKQAEAHWAHMVVHGTLHLLGYDHINETDAKRMEARETELLSAMGYPAPYEGQH